MKDKTTVSTCYDDDIGENKEAVAYQSLNPCVDKSDPFAEKVLCVRLLFRLIIFTTWRTILQSAELLSARLV